jgi:hypothetical protein
MTRRERRRLETMSQSELWNFLTKMIALRKKLSVPPTGAMCAVEEFCHPSSPRATLRRLLIEYKKELDDLEKKAHDGL